MNDKPEQKNIWSTWSEDYFKTLYKDVTEYPALVLRHKYILDLFDLDGKKILDIGCGPGEMVKDLLSRGCQVFGMDIAEGMLKVARNNLEKWSGNGAFGFGCGDIEHLSFKDKTFDGVVCAGVIEYLKEDSKSLGELNRILRKDGELILTVRNAACGARVFDSLTNIPKSSNLGRSLIKPIKRLTSRDGKKEMDPYIPYRKHTPWKLDKKLATFGFVKQGFHYFHFYPFFVPFDKVFPKTFISLGLRMERFSQKRLGILASGYIVKARKVRDV
ncbi:MAG TPA: class I SAM-dependent methyltransferase [Syntrophorhabdaceae bacterium]|nr:class I SAM-dependent methyltransferase [Syntrophorhabdaceae bacterium]